MEATSPAYPTRLSETQWAILPAYFADDSQLAASQNQPASRDRSHSVRLARRFWRILPWEFPPWQNVYGYFRPWRYQGSWKRIHRYLSG